MEHEVEPETVLLQNALKYMSPLGREFLLHMPGLYRDGYL
jgi:hypothetical protein